MWCDNFILIYTVLISGSKMLIWALEKAQIASRYCRGMHVCWMLFVVWIYRVWEWLFLKYVVTMWWYAVLMTSFFIAFSCIKVGVYSYTDVYAVTQFSISWVCSCKVISRSVLWIGLFCLWNQCMCLYFSATVYHGIVTIYFIDIPSPSPW